MTPSVLTVSLAFPKTWSMSNGDLTTASFAFAATQSTIVVICRQGATMRTTVLLTLLSASLLFAQSPSVTEKEVPTVVTFVAAAFPRAAKDQRKMQVVGF